MKKSIIGLFLFSILLLFPFQDTLSQPQDREEFHKMRQERELRDTIKVYMYYKMKTALDLTDEQEKELIPKVEDMELERHRFMDEKRTFLEGLKEMLEDAKTSDEAILKEVDYLKAIEEKHRNNIHEKLTEVRALLSARQQGKFLLFMEAFREEIKRKIDRVRQMHQQQEQRRMMRQKRREYQKNYGDPEGDDE
jgi:hypothetical protein